MTAAKRPYRHGDLRRALLEVAATLIEEPGPGAMSMREVARRAGVTHAAATYHFGDKAGLLTALAVDGYRLLGDALREAHESRHSFLELGVAYVRFAVTYRAHFEVMFRPELYHRDDEELRSAKTITAALLYGTERASDEQLEAGVAGWAIVHGIATLWLNGNLPERLGDDPGEITRAVASNLRVRRP
jgi:AcrR family transcriptional regulator